MKLSKETALIFALIILIIIIVILLVRRKPKDKQGYSLSVMGTKQFKMTPWESSANNLDEPSPRTRENAELLQWWLNWKKDIPSHIMRQISAFCPNLQSDDVIRFNGMPVRMVNQLQLLRPTLEKLDKNTLRTISDIQRVFNSCALTGINEIGVINSNIPNKGVYNYVV